jgi:hypothetical protein
MFVKQAINAYQKHYVKYALVGGYTGALYGAINNDAKVVGNIKLIRVMQYSTSSWICTGRWRMSVTQGINTRLSNVHKSS